MKHKTDHVKLNPYCMGFAEWKDNCRNYSIFAQDPSADIYTNELYAGYIQGKLQGTDAVKAARNNAWHNTYLCDASSPDKRFPKEFDPSKEELQQTEKVLQRNYRFLYGWLEQNDSRIAQSIRRLLFRMYGIYEGVSREEPTSATFDTLHPDRLNFNLSCGDSPLSFGDLYFINAQSDLFDALSSSSKESQRGIYTSDHCSAFVKRTNDDIYWTHNTWAGFLCQSLTVSYTIGTDFITQNAYCPGQFGSNMDFGFNGQGICFNETTHRSSYIQSKIEGIWLCWRAAAAEMFSKSIDDFYAYIAVDNTGTYLNGYMLIDAKTNETALLEMSYKRFVLFRSNGETLTVKDSTGIDVTEDDYDLHLITPDHILGVNYPVSKSVAYDLQSTDNRPMRRIQLYHQIQSVTDMESAKALITYVGDDEPLSVYGRWDLGYGTTEYPKIIPDGAVDAKVFSANAVRELIRKMSFLPDKAGALTSFWMLYGTPKINGKPFIWSESQWAHYKKSQDRDFVPDRLEGAWNETKLFMGVKQQGSEKERSI